jgi:hypothetical protein
MNDKEKKFYENCHVAFTWTYLTDGVLIDGAHDQKVKLEFYDLPFRPAGVHGRRYIGYVLSVDDEKIFTGTDYSPSPLMAQDDIENVMGLLGYLTLTDEDIEEEYFEDYSDEQLEWRDSEVAKELRYLMNDHAYCQEGHFDHLSNMENGFLEQTIEKENAGESWYNVPRYKTLKWTRSVERLRNLGLVVDIHAGETTHYALIPTDTGRKVWANMPRNKAKEGERV